MKKEKFEWKHKYNITRADGSPIDWDDEGTGVCAGTLKLSKEIDVHKLFYALNTFISEWITENYDLETKGIPTLKNKLKKPRWRDVFPLLVECELEEK